MLMLGECGNTSNGTEKIRYERQRYFYSRRHEPNPLGRTTIVNNLGCAVWFGSCPDDATAAASFRLWTRLLLVPNGIHLDIVLDPWHHGVEVGHWGISSLATVLYRKDKCH
jgi:hypothetical protein